MKVGFRNLSIESERRDIQKLAQANRELEGKLKAAHFRINDLEAKLDRLVEEVKPAWNKEKECAICLEDKKPKEFLRFPCGHEVCMPCYETLRQEICPFCRAPTSTIKNVEVESSDGEYYSD